MKKMLVGSFKNCLFLVLTVLLLFGCATVKMPKNTKIIPPGPNIAKEIAVFSGGWGGNLRFKFAYTGGTRTVRIFVERINSPTDIEGWYCYDPWMDTNYNDQDSGCVPLHKAMYAPEEGTLEFGFTRNRGRVSCKAISEEEMEIVFITGSGNKLTATMHRIRG